MKDIKAESNKETPKLTGKSYDSVDDLINDLDLGEEVHQAMEEFRAATHITQSLAVMRAESKITQAKLAELMGVQQSRVSKIEGGADEDLTLGQVAAYAEATGNPFVIRFGPAANHVEAVKEHAWQIREHLTALAALANKHDELEPHISDFFGEAVFNILDLVGKCAEQLPAKNEEAMCLLRVGEGSDSSQISIRRNQRKSRRVKKRDLQTV